jgi:NADPH2 dehydrogenase
MYVISNQWNGGMNMTLLFSPYTLRDVTLKNRIVMSPMCMYSATEGGKATNWHRVHYVSRAIGQVGLIMFEATAVTPEGRISPQDLGIWSDEHIEGLASIVKEIQMYGAKTAIQLAHAGRKGRASNTIYAPSPIPFTDNEKVPTEMTKEDIQETINAFQQGALRAKQAGFDIIELHGAHGYLINEFLSPLTNKRQDEYGGSPENRFRFLKEAILAVQEVWEGPLFVRVSAHDYQDGGLMPNDYVVFAKWMKKLGVDVVDVSSGGVVPASIHAYPNYQVPFAEQIKKEAGIATGAVGMITTGRQAEEILQNEQADLIFIGRELLRDPYWPLRAANDLGIQLEAPTPYKRGWK